MVNQDLHRSRQHAEQRYTESMKNTLNWGVIGCGDVFEHKSGPSLAKAKRSQVRSLMRRDPVKLAALAQLYPTATTHSDAQEVLDDPNIDIIYIATPPSTHHDYVRAAAAAGKHVLVEKPMGLHAAESQAMIDACEKADVELFVAYYRRFWPHIIAIKKRINDGSIGNVQQAFVDFSTPLASGPLGWRLNQAINGGGYFVDMSTHRLDLLAYFFGNSTQIHGTHQHNDAGIELYCSALIEFPKQIQALVRSDFQSGRRADHFEIIGSSGRIHMSNIGDHHFTLQATQRDPSTTENKIETCHFEAHAATHLGLIEHIEDVLLDGASNCSSGNDGIHTDRIVDVVLNR